MYYVNTEKIKTSLEFVPYISEVCEQLQQLWPDQQAVLSFAQERALHLAIETVTDVGHMLIDGFLMRDASSYEDIIEILQGEGVLSSDLAQEWIGFVKLRKALVQEFVSFERGQLHPMIEDLPDCLQQFSDAVTGYLHKELGGK